MISISPCADFSGEKGGGRGEKKIHRLRKKEKKKSTKSAP